MGEGTSEIRHLRERVLLHDDMLRAIGERVRLLDEMVQGLQELAAGAASASAAETVQAPPVRPAPRASAAARRR